MSAASVTHNSATINVTITNSDGVEGTLYGQYGPQGGAFSALPDRPFSGTSVSWDLDSLDGATTYGVQVSLVQGDFSSGTRRDTTFTTDASPDISLDPEPGNLHRDSSYSYGIQGSGVLSADFSVSQTDTVITIADSAASLDCDSPSTTVSNLSAAAEIHVRACANGSATLTVTDSADSTVFSTYNVAVIDHPGQLDDFSFSSIQSTQATATLSLENPQWSKPGRLRPLPGRQRPMDRPAVPGNHRDQPRVDHDAPARRHHLHGPGQHQRHLRLRRCLR